MKQGLLLFFFLVALTANAQLSDSFSDGDFTANPAWQGEVQYYQVNPENQLQSNGPASVTTALWLSTPNALFQNTEWQFFVKIDFNGTNSNQARIYLMSDQVDLETSLNGYYVGIGQDGSADAVRLYRQQGPLTSAPVLLIPGIPGRAAKAANNTIKVKVHRDVAGNWTLYSDTTGTGNNFVLEGTASDNAVTATSYFGVLSRYTSANSTYRTKFFYDDFLIQEMPLQLVSAAMQSATQVLLQFSAPVGLPSAENQANYLVSGGVGNPVSAERVQANPSHVLLTFQDPLTPGVAYTVTVNNVLSQNGAALQPNSSATFTFLPPPVPVQPRDVVINELLVDESPALGLPAAEFLELFNTTNQPVNLSGFTLSDLTSTATFPAGATVPANGFLILTSTTNATLYSGFGQVLGLPGFPTLNNTADELTLRDPAGLIIDRVAYTTAWYHDPGKSNGGWTLEQINPFAACSGQSNWRASNNLAGGTPGTQNSVFNNTPDTTPPQLAAVQVISATELQLTFNEQLDSAQAANATYSLSPVIPVASATVLSGGFTEVILQLVSPLDSAVLYMLWVSGVSDCSGNVQSQPLQVQVGLGASPQPGELLLNEIMADPNPPVGLPAAEFVELHNTGPRLLSLRDIAFLDASSTALLPAAFIPAGGFVILTSATNAPLFQPFGQTLGLSGFPTLNDSGDSLVLQSASGTVLDRVQYTTAWYQDAAKAGGGWSLERKNPDLPCSGAANWAAAISPSGGTPGAQNSIYTTAPDQTAPQLTGLEVVSATQIRLYFSEQLSQASVAAAAISVSGGISVAARMLIEPLRTAVELTFSAALDSATVYTLIVSGLQDCSGNSSLPVSQPFGIGSEPGFQDLLITEIMADPSPVVGLPERDYVELFNASGRLLRLAGLRLSDPQATAVLPAQVMQPGEYLVVVTNTAAPLFAGFGRVIGVSDFPALNVTSDVITLRTASGKLIHSVAYTDDWYKSQTKKNGGWSLEMVDVQNPCAGISNWTASENPLGGTPAQPNSVSALNPDNTPPQLLRADVQSPTLVQLVFSEPVDSATAANPANYAIALLGQAVAAQVQGPVFETVTLTFGQPMLAGQTYTLTVNTLADCAGNMLSEPISVLLVLPQPAAAGDLVLNEILFNPRPGGVDFVELFNRSEKHLDLKNWQLANVSDGQTGSFRTLTELPYVLPPGAYVVLTTNAALVKEHYPHAREETFLQMASLPSFPDSRGAVVLLNPDSLVYDRLDYTSDMHFALIDDLNGVSLERINPNAPTNTGSNWQSAAAAAGFATPGYRNSQYMAAPGGTESISVSPKVFTPDSGGDADFTTITYRFSSPNKTANITVFDSEGREIKKLVQNQTLGTEGFFKWDGTTSNNAKANVGYYVFYIEVFDLSGGEVQVFKEPVVVGARF